MRSWTFVALICSTTRRKVCLRRQYVQRVLGLDPWDIHYRTKLDYHLGSLAQSREMHYITCWHLYRSETLAMWEGYGHDGVAVISQYKLLKAALSGLTDETHLGLIQYGASHLTNRFNAMEFITSKQLKYKPECEVRAMLTCSNPLDGGNRHIDLNNIPHPRPLAMNPRHSWVPECKRRRIVLKELVQRVVISPWADAGNVDEIELWNRLKGFSAPGHSELRGGMTMSLEDYRKHMSIRKPPPEPERVVTESELNHFYEELITLTPERARFLYRTRWEKCRLECVSLPSTLDLQYLDVTLKALKDIEKRR